MTKTHFALVICAALALSACGGGSSSDNVASDGTGGGSSGGGDNGSAGGGSGGGSGSPGGGEGPVAGDIEFFGMVSVTDSFGDKLDMSGSFIRFDTRLPFPSVEDAMKPTDNCTVTAGLTPPPDSSGGPDFGVNVAFVSAGTAIPFTSGSGSFASMPRQVEQGFTFYSADDVQGPPPAGLTVTIPGDVYPAFANIPVPENVPIQWIAPAQGETLTAQSTLTWEPGTNANAVVSVSATSISGTNPPTIQILYCDLIDDGSHTFSAATQAAMGASFSASAPPTVSRSVTSAHRNGSAVLFVERG